VDGKVLVPFGLEMRRKAKKGKANKQISESAKKAMQ
jgi:hypothetical protein